MNRTPQSRRFWRILGPILLYWLIQFVAQIIVQMAVMMLHVDEIAEIIQSTSSETYLELVAGLTVKMEELMARHQGVIAGFIAICTLPLTAFLFHRDQKREIRRNNGVQAVKYLWILLFGAAFCLGMNVLTVMSGLAMQDTAYLSASADLYTESLAVLLVCQGIVVPVAEEMMFRGVLYRRCREQMQFWPAAFAVSCLFAFTHSSVTQLLYTFVLALFLSYFYEKFGSFRAPVLLHIVVNVVSVTVTKTAVLNWICADFLRMSICVVACAFAAASAFVMIMKIKAEKRKKVSTF